MDDRFSLGDFSKLEDSYFGLQAYWGSTKHMGGLRATRELIELCHIGEGKYVLDVGCGVGITSCYVAKLHSCRLVGVDISERMVARARERAGREGVEDRVEFRVADAYDLPFEDGIFDAVICESINAFVEDKERAVGEYMRVVKPGGYVGFNEVTWLKAPPLNELVKYLYRTTGAVGETSDVWEGLLEGSGLRDVVVRVYKPILLREYIDRVRQIGSEEFVRSLFRFLSLYLGSAAFRRYVKEIWPKSFRGFFEYLGYGIYVGRK